MKNSISILLVDDDEDDYVLTRALLAEIDGKRYTLDWLTTFEAGLHAMCSTSHDLYLIDYHLGAYTGVQLLEQARKLGCMIPVILLTGEADRKIDLMAMAAGAADYLVKGEFGTDQLERAIRYAINWSQTLEELRESEERYALAMRGARDGIWDWNIKSGRIYFSPRWKSMLGCEDSDIGAQLEDWFSRVHRDDVGRLKAALADYLDDKAPHYESEHRMLHKDGEYLWMLSRGMAVRDVHGDIVRMAGSQTNISDYKRLQAQLLHDAFHDTLTGLPNKALFVDRLAHSIEQSKRRPGYLFAVLFLDLDRFKLINDSLGHLIGDQLLIGVARRLERCIRPGDTVARFGGDEFTMLLDDMVNRDDATHVADRIKAEMSTAFMLSGNEIFSNASIGIALSFKGYDNPAEVLRDSDTAMYRAKALGKARHQVFDNAMHVSTMSALRLETDMRRGVARAEFLVYYQPIVSLATGDIITIEALARWQHPELGMMSADDFIPTAEENGSITAIGEFLMRTACQQMKLWRDAGHGFRLAVNFSARQLQHEDLPERIESVLKQTGLPHSAFELEVTETVAMGRLDSVFGVLKRVSEMGIHIAIDDFGTGYSSLSYLKRFPINTLKIDRSFIRGMTSSSRDIAIPKAIIAMAHGLNLQVVAEGVETEEQRAFLQAHGCDNMQGYLYSRPLSADGLSDLLREKYPDLPDLRLLQLSDRQAG